MSDSNKVYKITPILNPRLWGTDRLASLLRLSPPHSTYGEVFMVSSMENAECIIDDQPFHAFYQNHPEFFNLNCNRFPLRINLIDTSSPLSIQVHPGKEITEQLGYPSGIHEFWLILETKPDSTIELGHRFESREEMLFAVQKKQIANYCLDVPVRNGEYFHLHPGTMHAIGAGVLVYECTCNLDLTYRLYDYDRIDPNTGLKRQLHVEEATSALAFPQNYIQGNLEDKPIHEFEETTLVDEPGVFTLKQWRTDGVTVIPLDTFYFCTIIQGTGMIEDQPVSPFETIFVPAINRELKVDGVMTILAASYRE